MAEILEIKKLISQPWTEYDEAKKRSADIDSLLGFHTQQTEILLQSHLQNSQTWTNLSPQSFQTPYPELYQIIQLFGVEALRWIDFGCAYGRLGLILNWFRPQDSWLGYESSQERITEGNRILREWCQLPSQIIQQDLRENFVIPQFDIAFIYDFGRVNEIDDFLFKLQTHARASAISVVARGRATRHLIETHHPWLSQVIEPYHEKQWSLYRSHETSAGRSI